MNLGIRFHDTVNLPFEQRVKNIRSQGFGCAHVALYRAYDNFAGDTALTPGFAMHLKKIFAENDLDFAVLGCYLNLLHPNQEELQKIQATYRAHLQFASWLGCGVVGTETGCPNPQYKFVPDCHTEACFNQFVHNLSPIVEYAEKLGVFIGIEPVYRHSIFNPKRAGTLIKTIASPNLKIILDPVNLLCAENAGSHTDIIDEALEILGDDIAVLHLKDFISNESEFRSVPAGFGQMDYTNLMRFMKKYKPYIHATLEDTSPENAKEALQKMHDAYDRA